MVLIKNISWGKVQGLANLVCKGLSVHWAQSKPITSALKQAKNWRNLLGQKWRKRWSSVMGLGQGVGALSPGWGGHKARSSVSDYLVQGPMSPDDVQVSVPEWTHFEPFQWMCHRLIHTGRLITSPSQVNYLIRVYEQEVNYDPLPWTDLEWHTITLKKIKLKKETKGKGELE